MSVFKLPPPPPTNDLKGSAWQDWFYKITRALGTILHNELSDVQGGTTNQYYHLTLAQLTDLTDAGDSTLHYHATDRARANHTGTAPWSAITPGNSTDVAAVVTDETGSPGSLVFSGNPTLAGITNSGNLTFTGTGNRIKALFSGVPIADRVGFQTTEAATYTALQVIPSAGGAGGYIFANALPDVENTNYIYIGASTGVCQFVSNKTGTGTVAPMTFHVGASEMARIATDATFTAGGTSTAPALKVTPVASQARWIEVTGATSSANPQLATTAGELLLPQNIVIPKTSGKGIQVDTTTPTFPWHDILGLISIRGVGAADPGYNIYQGGIRGYQFAVNDEVFVEFHLPHDYLPASDLYIHAHWSVKQTTKAGAATNAVTGGSVTWGFEVTYAKGHNQAAFATPITTTIAQNASTTQYQHMIAEVQLSAETPSGSQLDSDNIEVDGLILVRCYLSANNMTVSSGSVPAPFLHMVDIHYQSTNIGTKQKAPNFYT